MRPIEPQALLRVVMIASEAARPRGREAAGFALEGAVTILDSIGSSISHEAPFHFVEVLPLTATRCRATGVSREGDLAWTAGG